MLSLTCACENLSLEGGMAVSELSVLGQLLWAEAVPSKTPNASEAIGLSSGLENVSGWDMCTLEGMSFKWENCTPHPLLPSWGRLGDGSGVMGGGGYGWLHPG